ncbi:Outer membrane protein HopP [Helicobacter sp. NHP19-012]|uniref:Outer membrane protein HopP n=1 Tax=Helicobacter gastrofelis TaxID=2849642 RepID=A0ABM7SGA7_9HELI|nr:outer membrane beta-barrel protein [Helicobacter sp. NHP19-012]BCZ19892.1 Outer membrane protein HopP [Helicobacter sp. NHP19-012]
MLKRLLLAGLVLHPLGAVKNHVFTGVRFGMAQNFKSTFSNQVSMNNPSTLPDNASVYACPDNLCKNNEIEGFYKPSGNKSANFAFTYTLGDELFFDKFGISGLRVYGDIEYANANLGHRYKVQNKGGLNYNPANIKAIDPNTGQVIPIATTNKNGQVTYTTPQGYSSPCAALTATNPLGLCPTPTPQEVLLTRPAHMVTLGLNVDFFLNIPIDIWLRKKHPKMMFFKMGVFVGGGVEYAMLWSDNFNNEALSALGGNSLSKGHIDKTRFFAAGNGFYVNVGYQLYLGQHNRFNLGWKLPYYSISAHNWYNYGNTNPGTQQTIKQTLAITRQSQFYVGYAYLF